MDLRDYGKLRFAASLLVVMVLPLCLAGCEARYTGPLFTTSRAPNLCAKATDDDGSALSYETGEFALTTVWGRTIFTQPVTTNALGVACLRMTLPSDVYHVRPGTDDFLHSIPSVLTVYSSQWAGVFAGGRIELNTKGLPPMVRPSAVRSATFGIINRTIEDEPAVVHGGHPSMMPPGKPARLIFLDPEHPEGELAVAAQDFTLQLMFGGPGVGIERIQAVRLYGACSFPLIETSFYPSHYFEAVLAKGESWDDPSFSIQVFRYPGVLVYQASGKILDGDVVLKCTGGHGGG